MAIRSERAQDSSANCMRTKLNSLFDSVKPYIYRAIVVKRGKVINHYSSMLS